MKKIALLFTTLILTSCAAFLNEKIDAVEKDGYYQITVNTDAFSSSEIKNAETTAK